MAKPSIAVTGLCSDQTNSNTRIRSAVATGAERSGLFSRVDIWPIELMVTQGDMPYDVVFAVGSGTSDTISFERLRRNADKSGTTLVFWTHEDPYEFDLNKRLLPFCDWFFTNESSALPYYNSSRVEWLPLAADLRYDRPVRPQSQRNIDLFFCGYGYPFRLHALQRIAGVLAETHELAIFGPNLASAVGELASARRLSTEEFAETCTYSLLTLNIGRDLDIANNQFNIAPETPGPRTFDVALSGCPQIVFDDGMRIDEFYVRDREILLFDNVDDIENAIDTLRREPERCESIAHAAKERTMTDHLYEHRIARMMEVIGA